MQDNSRSLIINRQPTDTPATGPLVVIVGETASGKSKLAMELAKQFNGEIINADSWQIYKGMDIGTAKPSPDDMSAVKHHLFDIVEPDEDFTAAVYKTSAQTIISAINQKGNLPIMVGGTGLYIDSVLFNYSFAPQSNPELRQELNKKSIDELLLIINQKKLDLTTIDIRNKRRLIRLIETGGIMPTQSKIRENILIIGTTSTRAKLRQNIEKRIEIMFHKGLKHEVRELSETYGWEVEAMKGVGYREFKDYFEGRRSLAETKRKILRSTLNLAKKQRTWFKRNKNIQWINNREEAVDLITTFLSKLNK